jgi:ribosomal protein S5
MGNWVKKLGFLGLFGALLVSTPTIAGPRMLGPNAQMADAAFKLSEVTLILASNPYVTIQPNGTGGWSLKPLPGTGLIERETVRWVFQFAGNVTLLDKVRKSGAMLNLAFDPTLVNQINKQQVANDYFIQLNKLHSITFKIF